jgi:hypothetical protein
MNQNPPDTLSRIVTKAIIKEPKAQSSSVRYNHTENGRKRRQQWAKDNPRRMWCSSARNNAKRRAVKKGLPFDLSGAYIYSILPDKCPVFGTTFKFRGNGVLGPSSPSIDRIDPAKGYVEGNIVIISIKANQIKNAFTMKDIRMVADWMEREGY